MSGDAEKKPSDGSGSAWAMPVALVAVVFLAGHYGFFQGCLSEPPIIHTPAVVQSVVVNQAPAVPAPVVVAQDSGDTYASDSDTEEHCQGPDVTIARVRPGHAINIDKMPLGEDHSMEIGTNWNFLLARCGETCVSARNVTPWPQDFHCEYVAPRYPSFLHPRSPGRYAPD